MSLRLKIGNAPVSWGVFTADDPANPSWRRVLDEIAATGYRFVELGPYGFLPTDPDVLRAELADRGLTLLGAFLYEQLSVAGDRSAIEDKAMTTCDLLRRLSGRYLVVIDAMNPLRMASAGQSSSAQRLHNAAWEQLVDTVREVSDLASDRGIRSVFHPHVGSYVEFDDEIDRLLSDTDRSKFGLCLDTGHAAYAGLDPVELYRTHASTVEYLHLKDVDVTVRDQATANGWGWEQAVTERIFCPLGEGCVDFEALQKELAARTFGGPAVVEQDTETGHDASAGPGARQSLAFLGSCGFTAAASGNEETTR